MVKARLNIFTHIFLVSLSIPIGIVSGLIGVSIGMIEDILYSIKKEKLEATKYPEWKKQYFINYYLKKHQSMSDYSNDSDNVDTSGIKQPKLIIVVIGHIVVNLLLYPILIVWSLWKGPQRAYTRLSTKLKNKS